MKKQILNLGKTLSKNDQKQIKGGFPFESCEQFCSWNGGRNREWYLQNQLERHGLDWSNCPC